MNRKEVTQEQLAACTRKIDSHGNPYYEVQSASDPDTTYTVRWKGYQAQDNCIAGRHGIDCWHCRAATLKEKIFQGLVDLDAEEARSHELSQLALDGFKCYERKEFALMR